MGLAMTMGLCWHHLGATVPGFQPVAAETTFLLGARDLDPPEAALLQGSAITPIPVGQIPEGLPGLLARVPLADTLGYLHLDVDVLDPAVGHANDLPAPNGLSLPHLTAAIAVIRARVPLAAAALASYLPEDDHDQGVCERPLPRLMPLWRTAPNQGMKPTAPWRDNLNEFTIDPARGLFSTSR
jgi:arginase family enzyme